MKKFYYEFRIEPNNKKELLNFLKKDIKCKPSYLYSKCTRGFLEIRLYLFFDGDTNRNGVEYLFDKLGYVLDYSSKFIEESFPFRESLINYTRGKIHQIVAIYIGSFVTFIVSWTYGDFETTVGGFLLLFAEGISKLRNLPAPRYCQTCMKINS